LEWAKNQLGLFDKEKAYPIKMVEAFFQDRRYSCHHRNRVSLTGERAFDTLLDVPVSLGLLILRHLWFPVARLVAVD
jgi:hypothetical protein